MGPPSPCVYVGTVGQELRSFLYEVFVLWMVYAFDNCDTFDSIGLLLLSLYPNNIVMKPTLRFLLHLDVVDHEFELE